MVGNDDDASEFSLAQLKTLDNMTPREKGALIEAGRLKKALDGHWQKQSSDDPSFPPDTSPPYHKGRDYQEESTQKLQAVPQITVGTTRLGLAICTTSTKSSHKQILRRRPIPRQ